MTTDRLIARWPSGSVPVMRLGDVVRIRNGRDYKHLENGPIPVYGSGGIMTRVSTAAYDKPSVLIPRKGSLGNIFYVDEPFWTVDTIFYTEIDQTRLIPKFLYYYLLTRRLEKLNQAGGVPSQTQAVLNELRVPIPSHSSQHEIVRILDSFKELEAELEARRRQYAHYRDELLTFGARRPVADVG